MLIHQMLELSTEHLPEDVCSDLNGFEGVVADRREFGWLLWVPDDVDDWFASYPGLPPSLLTVLRFARSRGCDYVLFDAEGDGCPDLPVYDW